MQTLLKATIISVLVGVLIFSSPLSGFAPWVSFLDELLALASLPVLIAGRFIEINMLKIVMLMFLFVLLVLVTTGGASYFRGIPLSLLDLFLFLKPLLIAFLFLSFSQGVKRTVHNYLSYLCAGIIVSSFFAYPLNLAGVFKPFDYRFGIGSYSFIFSNPGEFFNIILLCTLIVYSQTDLRFRNLLVVAGVFLAFSTLRFKAFVLITFAVFIVMSLHKVFAVSNPFWVVLRRRVAKIFSVRRVMLLALLSLVPGWVQFQAYFLSDMTPRLFILLSGYELSLERFPFGVGPGTFGSAVSKMFYSPVYLYLGFEGKYGLSSDETNFLSDNFWPMVFAQYGVVGACCVSLLYYRLSRYYYFKLLIKKEHLVSFFIVLVSLVLSTLGSAILIGYLGAIYIVFISLLVNRRL